MASTILCRLDGSWDSERRALTALTIDHSVALTHIGEISEVTGVTGKPWPVRDPLQVERCLSRMLPDSYDGTFSPILELLSTRPWSELVLPGECPVSVAADIFHLLIPGKPDIPGFFERVDDWLDKISTEDRVE
jgi:hypothetical protein